MKRHLKAKFFLKPVVNNAPLKWGGESVIRDVHFIVIAVDESNTIERPAKFTDAVEYPRALTLYRRRLKGPRGGKRKA